MSSRKSGGSPLAVRLFPLRQRITITVYITVLLALLVGIGAWTTTQMTRAQVASLRQMVEASARVRQYRTQIDQMQFASYRFIASNHDSAVDRVTRTYEMTQKSLRDCIEEDCSGNPAMDRIEALQDHLEAFYLAFEDAVEQRRAIETIRAGRFSEVMQTLNAATSNIALSAAPSNAQTISAFQGHLRSFDSAADALLRNDSVPSDLIDQFEEALTDFQSMENRGLIVDLAVAENALDELVDLYRQLLQRSRGHQFLVNVVMAGEAHEMQMIAGLLEDEFSASIEQAQISVDDRLHTFAIWLLALLLLGSALVFIVGRSMAKSVSLQIHKLSKIFSELAAGSEAPIRFTSLHNDEVGELVRAAERFREENVKQRTLIDRYRLLNEELEAKVAQRTKTLRSSNEELEHLANTDRLTGAFNRRALDVALTAELDRCRRYGSSLSLLFLDLDHFKHVNDEHGHVAGDQVLQTFVEELRALFRDTDILGRWGGEEFIVVCPDAGATDVLQLAERIRARIERYNFSEVGRVTVSVGIAELRPEDNIQDLIDRADQAMYEAKKNGRNCCVVAS